MRDRCLVLVGQNTMLVLFFSSSKQKCDIFVQGDPLGVKPGS